MYPECELVFEAFIKEFKPSFDVYLHVSWNDNIECKHEQIDKVCQIKGIISHLLFNEKKCLLIVTSKKTLLDINRCEFGRELLAIGTTNARNNNVLSNKDQDKSNKGNLKFSLHQIPNKVIIPLFYFKKKIILNLFYFKIISELFNLFIY